MAGLDAIKGFKVTMQQVFSPRITTQYPEQKRPKPPRFHGRHVLGRYEDGMEKCIGCELCAGVCPAHCIYVRGLDNPPDAPVSPGERYGYVYEINFLRCIHCDLCVEACPTEAITESKLFEFSFTNRSDAIYTKDELLVGDDGKPVVLPWEDWREGDDAMTSGWMRATSPSGEAAFEGVRQWSADLGYGARVGEIGQSGSAGAAALAGAKEFSVREHEANHLPGATGRRARGIARRAGVEPDGVGAFARPKAKPGTIQDALGPKRRPAVRERVLDRLNAGPVKFGSSGTRAPPGALRQASPTGATCQWRVPGVSRQASPTGATCQWRVPGVSCQWRLQMSPHLLGVTIPDGITFAGAALMCVVGAFGVVLARNPVHSALFLILTLFGVAVLFVEQDAQFLAAVQVIVYAGAIVVLFLFVIMLIGVDRRERLAADPLKGQRPIGVLLGLMALAEVLLLSRTAWPTGQPSVAGPANGGSANVAKLGESVFTTYLLAFEVTSALLVIAVVGAVVLARRQRPRRPAGPTEPEPAAASSEPSPAVGGGPGPDSGSEEVLR